MLRSQRCRAGRAVADRINSLGGTVPQIARAAGIDPRTLRRLINGDTWPYESTRIAVCQALDWPDGELARRAADSLSRPLANVPTRDLVLELCRRYQRQNGDGQVRGHLMSAS